MILFYAVIIIAFASPILAFFVAKKIRGKLNLMIKLGIYFIGAVLLILSPLEIYSRVLNLLLFISVYVIYCMLWALIPRIINYRILTVILSTALALPILSVIAIAAFNLPMPLIAIVLINDSINIHQRVQLENSYLIEDSNWGWVSSSGKEYRLYKVIIPYLLKYQIDGWKESDYKFNPHTIRIDTTEWKSNRVVRIIDKGKVLHEFSLNP